MPPPELANDISWSSSARRPRATHDLQPSPEVDSLWIATTPVMSASGTFVACARRVQELAVLPAGWDSYGSRSIEPAAVDGALRVLRAADSELLPVPHVSPVADGGLQVEWTIGERSVEVEVRPSGAVEFLVDLGAGVASEGMISQPEDVRAVLDLLRR